MLQMKPGLIFRHKNGNEYRVRLKSEKVYQSDYYVDGANLAEYFSPDVTVLEADAEGRAFDKSKWNHVHLYDPLIEAMHRVQEEQ